MDMNAAVRQNPLLAIMRKVPLDKTIPYAQAAFDGGVAFFEVAMNSPHGAEQIAMLTTHFAGKALIGAGTAITVDRAKAALDAGATFLLTPSSPVAILEFCAKEQVPLLPGVLTPTEVNLCMDYGFTTLKLFPAGDMPMGYVKSLKGPLDGTDYVAIGGVTPENAAEFLRAGYIGIGLGSNLFPKEYVETNAWDKAASHVAAMVASLKQ